MIVFSMYRGLEDVLPCASFTRPVMMMTMSARTLATVEMT